MTDGEGRQIPFFRGWSRYADRVAVLEESGRSIRYGELARWADEAAPPRRPDGRRSFGLVFCEPRVEALVAYLASLRAGSAAALVHEELAAERREELARAYEPDWIVAPERDRSAWEQLGYIASRDVRGVVYLVAREAPSRPEPHEDLRLLLSTSGSTGSAKMVRLSERNLAANARSIATYMGLDADHRALLTLPFHYCFGLSVINSHLQVGATVLLTTTSFVQPALWEFAASSGANVLAGVPFHFETWKRLGLDRLAKLPLRVIAQAGGALSEERQEDYRRFAAEQGARFFVMYGQSEATARMSYVPPEELGENLGTIGVAVPEGRLELDPETSEIIYRGPNVMLGYAEAGRDLSRGDDLGGVLRTGDVGRVEANGLFRVVGRLSRFSKLFGERVGLDELERELSRRFGAQIACTGVDDQLFVAVEPSVSTEDVEEILRRVYRLRPAGLTVQHVSELPRLSSGKTDYVTLRRLAEAA